MEDMADDTSSWLGLSRLPPSNVPAEQAFLGALLCNNKVLDRAGPLLAQHFADPINGRIFDEAQRLIGEGRVVDAVTLKAAFGNSGILDEVGGVAYLTQLLTAMVGIINAGDYAREIRSTWLRRQLIDAAEIMSNEAHELGPRRSPEEIAMAAIAMIDAAINSGGGLIETNTTLDQAMDAAIAAIEKARGGSAGLSTGFNCIDARLGGLEPGLIYVLAGRPGSGKSALGHRIALNAALCGVPVLELSLEMSATQLGRRALATFSGVPLNVMKTGQISQGDGERLTLARRKLHNLPLIIDDAAGQTPRMIAAKCRAAKRKHGALGLVMLDHLNLTRPDEEDARHGPTYVIERACGTMLQIAKDLNVPVLLLTQLNRGVENREDKRPMLADLRQAGAIEQDAYAVGFVYREEYYLNNEPERKEGELDERYIARLRSYEDHKASVAGKADLIWAKVRDGEPGTDHLLFDGRTTTFSEPADGGAWS